MTVSQGSFSKLSPLSSSCWPDQGNFTIIIVESFSSRIGRWWIYLPDIITWIQVPRNLYSFWKKNSITPTPSQSLLFFAPKGTSSIEQVYNPLGTKRWGARYLCMDVFLVPIIIICLIHQGFLKDDLHNLSYLASFHGYIGTSVALVASCSHQRLGMPE